MNTINRAQANELWAEVLTARGEGWLRVLTGSMVPLLRPGDKVLVSKLTVDQLRSGDIAVLRSGDIAVFWRDSDLIVHRILRRRRTARGVFFSEKGDVTYAHSLVSAEKVIGRVVAVKGNGKLLGLGSSFSRLASQALSVWFYSTTAIVTALRSSISKTMRKAGKVLSIMFLLSSNILIRICCIVWYLSALFGKSNAGSNSRTR